MSRYQEFWYDWMGANNVLFVGINSIRGEAYDHVIRMISWLGEQQHFPHVLMGLVGWIVFSTLIKLLRRKKGIGYYLSSWVGILIMLVVGFVVNGIVVHELKDMFAMPRPQIVYEKPKVLETRDDFKSLETNYVVKVYTIKDMHILEEVKPEDLYKSFPSSHVAFAVLLVVALWPVLNNFMAWTGVAFIALMSWARVSLGVNFPADAVGAVIIFTPLMMLLQAGVYQVLFKVFRLKC